MHLYKYKYVSCYSVNVQKQPSLGVLWWPRDAIVQFKNKN